MAILRSSSSKTLEIGSSTNSSTPSKLDPSPSSTPNPSPNLGLGLGLWPPAPMRRRSLRLASISPSSESPIESRKRNAIGEASQSRIGEESRVSVEIEEGEKLGGENRREVRVLDEVIGSMSLRSGARIPKRKRVEVEDKVEINLEESLDFEKEEELMDVDEVEEESVQTVDERGKGKGKGKVDFDLNVIDLEDEIWADLEEIRYENMQRGGFQEVGEGSVNIPSPNWWAEAEAEANTARLPRSRKEAEKNKALELAPKYAFFNAKEEGCVEEEEDDDDDDDDIEVEAEGLGGDANMEEDWPGPFSTAMSIVRDQEKVREARELNSSSSKKDKDSGSKIQWTPSNKGKDKMNPKGKKAKALYDLCLDVLCENADEIESLNGVPDVLKHKLVLKLCQSRKMSFHILSLLLSGSPMDILLCDCSWAKEDDFEGAFAGCSTEKLKVAQFDISGRCLPDFVLQATLARSPNCLPLLTTLSLKGNYRLSDGGLNAIVASAPLLSSVNLSQCSLITSAGIIGLANKLELVLRELVINDCQDVDAMVILPSLLKLKHLEVLSVAGIETVSNRFVKKLVSGCGSTLKELVFYNCRKLTAVSMKAIGEHCSQLCSLDLRNLNRLKDSAIGHLANGCRSIKKLKLCSNEFSDEAVAAFLEVSGGSLLELSVNNIRMVADHTAEAISRRCSSTLERLDLSFCRKITDQALGLVVDSCLNLQTLKIFGCTQVTNVFLEGHSNPTVTILGSKGPALDQIETLTFL